MDINATLALAGVAVASVTDWRTRKVPNWLTLPLVIIGIIAGLAESGLSGLAYSMLGAGCGFLLFALPFAMGWMGGGDTKLLIALGAVLGASGVLWVALYGAVAGGIGALGLVVHRMARSGRLLLQLRLFCTALGLWMTQPLAQARAGARCLTLPETRVALRAKYPYALAIAAGTLIAVLRGEV